MKEGARTDFRAQTEDEGSVHAWKGVCIMNKIYKVVWNAARNSYMVGSEFIRGSHSAGSRRISGRKLKGLVAAALLAGTVLLPLSGAQVSAKWGDDYGPAFHGNANKIEHEWWQDKQIKDLKDNQQDVSGLQEDIEKQGQAIETHETEIGALKDAFENSAEKDRKQDGAIIGGIIKDRVQDEALKQETEERKEADKTLGEGLSQLGSDLVDEVTEREEGDKQLQANIDKEVADRAEADKELQRKWQTEPKRTRNCRVRLMIIPTVWTALKM